MFTIGDFSRITHISTRMLRHYHKLGLLCPAHKNEETGYRYYDGSQLATVRQIETLKDYGFRLATIKELLALPQQELAKRIHLRRMEAYEELAEARKMLRRMEDEIIKMEGSSLALEKYNVIMMPNPEQTVFGVRKTIHVGEIHNLFQQLHQEMEKQGIQRTGATQLMYFDEEFSYDNMDVEAQVEVAKDTAGAQQLPACQCIATTHVGPYETIKYAYEALGAWLAEHPEYHISGPAIERYLKDEHMANGEELETGVLFPVQKAGDKSLPG